jgi:hypothetical protein
LKEENMYNVENIVNRVFDSAYKSFRHTVGGGQDVTAWHSTDNAVWVTLKRAVKPKTRYEFEKISEMSKKIANQIGPICTFDWEGETPAVFCIISKILTDALTGHARVVIKLTP